MSASSPPKTSAIEVVAEEGSKFKLTLLLLLTWLTFSWVLLGKLQFEGPDPTMAVPDGGGGPIELRNPATLSDTRGSMLTSSPLWVEERGVRADEPITWSRKSMSKSIPPAWGTFPLGHSPWVCGKGGGGGGGITTVDVDDEASMPER